MNEHPDIITVMLLGSSYAAIRMRYYDDIKNYDIQQTGFGRYKAREKAIREAKNWSASDEIEFKL